MATEVMAGSRNTLVALLCAGLALAFVPGTAFAAGPIKDPALIACPSPPAGWTNPPGTGKTVQSPQLNENLATLGASDQAEVTCEYFDLPTKHVLVVVSYAVPDDINPVSDFYWGCRSGGTPWDDSTRVFRVMSPHQWAIAAFSDVGGDLSRGDAQKFETITRQLLQNAEGFGHTCARSTSETFLTSNFHYSFKVAAGQGSGSFWATLGPKPTSTVPVGRVMSVTISLQLTRHGVTQPLTIRVERGFDYSPAGPRVTGRVRLGVKVVASKVPSCHAGNTGTLTITTRPSVKLAICGQTFLQGAAQTEIQYFY